MNELFLVPAPAAFLVFREGLVVGLGVLFGLVWGRRTGWGCGGLITPGLLALHAASPHRVGLALLLGVLLAAPLGLLARFLGLYGRERAEVWMPRVPGPPHHAVAGEFRPVVEVHAQHGERDRVHGGAGGRDDAPCRRRPRIERVKVHPVSTSGRAQRSGRTPP